MQQNSCHIVMGSIRRTSSLVTSFNDARVFMRKGADIDKTGGTVSGNHDSTTQGSLSSSFKRR
eukprot:scaffold1508_cov178-Amphora_coffeaeformis.AAC.23